MNVEILNSIFQGWKNFTFKAPAIEKMATERAKLCAGCDNADPNYPFKGFIPGEKRIREIKGLACGICGCPLSSKLRSPLEKCPDNPPRW